VAGEARKESQTAGCADHDITSEMIRLFGDTGPPVP
jgi:hypothetical protein